MRSNGFHILACAFLFCISLHALPAAEIHDALRHGDIAKAMDLLTNNPSLVSSIETDGDYTPLHWASQLGQTNVVRWLLEHKADPNAVAMNNFTPLHLAKNGITAKLLLQHDADPKKIDVWGKTPLQEAAEQVAIHAASKPKYNDLEHREVTDAILESGYPIELSSALWLGKRDEAKKIIKENPSIIKQVREDFDLWGNTSPLGIAAKNGGKEIVTLLLKAGAPVDAATEIPNVRNVSALCEAVWAGNAEIVELLGAAGADCNISLHGRDFETLLEYAKKTFRQEDR